MTRVNCSKEGFINYDAVDIPAQNIPAHLDIEKDIRTQQNGLFTFIIKVANGMIADYNVVEYVNISKYLRLKKIIIEQFTISRTVALGNQGNPVGTDNGQRSPERWRSAD